MKTLYLIRHAKSSWKDSSLSDWERPLNKRGKRDAPFMAQLLVDKGIRPDLIISSFANRALTTAKVFARTADYPENEIDVRKEVYMAHASELLNIIKAVSDEHDTLFMFGHNPDFTFLANQFNDGFIDNVPTCGIVHIVFQNESWAEIDYDNGQMLNFEYPKKYLNE